MKAKIKICVFTAARSDYFLLKPLLYQLKNNADFDLNLIVTGMHLSPAFGETWKMIVSDGFEIKQKVDILSGDNESIHIINSMSHGMTQYAKLLSELKPNIVIILGDRFEMMSIAISAYMLEIPIAHIHGGELTFGSFDDGLRHCISKMASLHFPAAEDYYRRIVQMGENPDSVFNVGALAVENITNTKSYSKSELAKKLNISLNGKYFLVTFHPETRNNTNALDQVEILINTLSKFPDYQVIWTISNADPQGKVVNEYLRAQKNKFFLIENLGKLYLPVLKKASIIIGNSSSGIIEAPIAGVPTVNIGTRQEGRLRTKSIKDCAWHVEEIYHAILNTIKQYEELAICSVKHPYGGGNTSEKITNILLKANFHKRKTFYDLPIIQKQREKTL